MSEVPGRERDRDVGESLVELLVSMAIFGLAGTAILSAVGASSSASALHRNQATAQNLIRNWAEGVSNATYTSCAVPADFAATKPNLTGAQYAGYAASVTGVRYWDGAGFAASCAADTGLQQVKLVVTAPASLGPGFDQTLDVVVRKPCKASC
jgi:type II secretory pathway pseudopilin PulG